MIKFGFDFIFFGLAVLFGFHRSSGIVYRIMTMIHRIKKFTLLRFVTFTPLNLLFVPSNLNCFCFSVSTFECRQELLIPVRTDLIIIFCKQWDSSPRCLVGCLNFFKGNLSISETPKMCHHYRT